MSPDGAPGVDLIDDSSRLALVSNDFLEYQFQVLGILPFMADPSITEICINRPGEVWVEGRSHAGVLGQTEAHDATADTRILTGDIGQWVEREGQRYLQIVGRRKNVVITSFGRNVSPEWPERLLMDSGLFRQAVVMGDGQPNLRAVLVPAGLPDTQQMAAAVERANQQLPDYARIAQWHVSPEPFTPDNGLSTPNGRPLRGHIEANFADAFTV